METFESKIILAEKSLNNIRGIFEKEKISSKLDAINLAISKEDFWKDKNKVKKILKEKKLFENISISFKNSVSEIKDVKDLYNLGVEEKIKKFYLIV